MLKPIFLTLLLVLTGCAAKTHWERGDSTANDFNMDSAQCRAQALAGTGGMLSIGTVLIMDSCLQGKGWALVADQSNAVPVAERPGGARPVSLERKRNCVTCKHVPIKVTRSRCTSLAACTTAGRASLRTTRAQLIGDARPRCWGIRILSAGSTRWG